MKVSFRDKLRAGDRLAVAAIVRSSGFFNAEECAVAVSLVNEYLSKGERSGYRFIFAEIPSAGSAGRSPLEKGTNNHSISKVVAYACYGPIAGTQSSFDLYWIAVHADHRGQQIGKRLLDATVDTVRESKGTRLYADTSSRDQYAPTRRFYESNGFERQAVLPDFYAPGDDKVIYCRRLC